MLKPFATWSRTIWVSVSRPVKISATRRQISPRFLNLPADNNKWTKYHFYMNMGDCCVFKDRFLCSLTQTQLAALQVNKETFGAGNSSWVSCCGACHGVLQIVYDFTQSVQWNTAAALETLPSYTLSKMTTERLWKNQWNMPPDVWHMPIDVNAMLNAKRASAGLRAWIHSSAGWQPSFWLL